MRWTKNIQVIINNMIKNKIQSLTHALRGFKNVWLEEGNFRLITFFAVVALVIGYYFDFTLTEFSICAVIITIVMVAEMVNTAIEDLCNKIEPNQDPAIGKIKDISSGFVFVSSLGALVAGFLVFWIHFMSK